jgi:hypothetical protein
MEKGQAPRRWPEQDGRARWPRELFAFGWTLREIFALEEGPVTHTFRAELPATDYQDSADHRAILLRKAKRKSNRRVYSHFVLDLSRKS